MSQPNVMTGVYLHGHGGPDQLRIHHDIAVPVPESGEVLIRVGGSSVNNTDINTRTGWYSRGSSPREGSWSGTSISFPRIQGADCCGQIEAIGEGVPRSRVGQRVLVRTMQDPIIRDGASHAVTLGSEIDGGFAQYTKVRASEALPVESDLTDVELASFPCSYSTALGLISRAGLRGENVLITGASGGVGSAALQIAVSLGAHVVASSRSVHHSALLSLGASAVVDRDEELLDHVDPGSLDLVVDVVGGDGFGSRLQALRPGGRYVTSGAVGGAIVPLDLRDVYLRDLTLIGCTFHPRSVFEQMIQLIEDDTIKPLVAASYPLTDIHSAQERFSRGDFVGKIGIEVSPPHA